MDHTAALASWKSALSKLADAEESIKSESLNELSTTLEHLSPETAPRLQKDYDSCTIKTHKCLGELFQRIDLSDKPLLCALLRLSISYGHFRMAQITYSTQDHLTDTEQNFLHFPQISKVKWYDMSPLLPEADNIGWKMILNHGMVKEEKKLIQVCLQLCALKLHFCSITLMLDKYQSSRDIIKKNGHRVAEKFLELIKDSGYDDYCMIGLDGRLFSLLIPFIDGTQQANIVETVIRDLFKPYFNQEANIESELIRLYNLIDNHLIVKQNLQQVLIDKLLEHLKLHTIRRKRRHSMEAADQEGETTLETLIDSIRSGEKLLDLVPKLDQVKVSKKSLQTKYLSFWIKVTMRILPQRILTATNSTKILSTCSIILLATSDIIEPELVNDLAFLLARTIDATGQSKLEKLFKICSPLFLIDLTKSFCERTQIITTFSSPMQTLYSSYLNRYLRFGLARGNKFSTDELVEYINFICEKNVDRGTSHLLEYIFIKQLARCFEVNKTRGHTALLETYMTCARKCAKRLFKFIKRNVTTMLETQEEDLTTESQDLDSSSDNLESEMKKTLVIDALLSILQLAIERQDQEILDSYSDLLLKIYSIVNVETSNACDVVKRGRSDSSSPVAAHMSKLLKLYVEHKDLMNAYLNYDLIEALSCLIFRSESSCNELAEFDSLMKLRKVRYSQIKKKLKTLSDQAKKSSQIYITIINKQYSSVIDSSLVTDMKREKPCCKSYLVQIQTLSSVASITLDNCSIGTYKSCLSQLSNLLDNCDPLDHPKFLFLLVLFESAIPKLDQNHETKMTVFKDHLQRLCCALLRISKTVELGPSIHAFSKPGNHKSIKAIQCCTYSNCLKIFTLIISKCPAKSINMFIPSALNLCISANLHQFAKHSAKLSGFFAQLAFAISDLLKTTSLVMKEEEIFKTSIPVFLASFSNLIGCVILASDARKLSSSSNCHSKLTNGFGKTIDDDSNEEEEQEGETTKAYEDQLEYLAIDISKTLNNLSSFRVRLVDFAPHLISCYVKDVQLASCPDFVRLHLNEGIFRIFNLIDAHQKERQEVVVESGAQRKISAGRASGSLMEMVHSRLDQASRGIFKDLHENYVRFHRYRGKC